MGKAGAAGRSLLLIFAVASLAACGPAGEARAPSEAQVLTASGPLRAATLDRLLLVDGARAGDRLVGVGDHGYIVLSDDGGASWRRAKSPDAPLLTAVTFVDATHGGAVGHDALILATTDGGETWATQFSAPSEQRPLLDVLFLDARRGIAVGAYGAYYETADGGATWTARKIIAGDRHLNAIVKVKDRLVIFGEAGTILASGDEGREWKPLDSPYKGSLFGGVVASDGAVVAFGLRGKIFRSADGGDHWDAVANDSTATLMGGARLSDGTLVLVGNAGTVLASHDGGRTFALASSAESARVFSAALAGPDGAALLLGDHGARAMKLTAARGGAAQ
jgi:photosystem II stability/assembly factor-like uncharacterized protein